MSSNNDDENDGLAALFGGVTPSTAPAATPPAAFESRRAAREAAQAAAAREAATARGDAPPAETAPADEAPPFEPPSFEPPSFEPPAYRQPAYEPSPTAPPASTPPSYDLPPPVSTPEPAPPPAYVPQVPPAYDLPAPAAAPPVAPTEPPLYPGLGPAAPAFTSPTSEPLTPPTLTPPILTPPPLTTPPVEATPIYGAPVPTTSGYDLPAPASERPVAPEPLAEPPASGGGFEALGLATPGRHPDAARRAPEPPGPADLTGDPGPEAVAAQPLVRAEPPLSPVRIPTEPLLPSETAAVETPENLERSTLLEKVGLALAVLTGPVGLGLAIFSAVRSGQRRGWIIGIVRASVVVGVLSTIATVIAGIVLWDVRADQLAHDEVAAASAEFCAVGAENPALVAPPTLGWPAPGETITDSLTLMREWTTRWTELAPASPDPLSAGLEHLAAKGEEIIAAVEQSRIVDDAASQAVIVAAATSSGVADWYETYCAAP